MKKIMHLLLMLLFFASIYATDLEKRVDQPFNGEFLCIFEHLECPHITTVKEANEFAQKNLLRRGERWDTQEQNPVRDIIKKNEASLLQDLKGMAILKYPHEKRYRDPYYGNYDYVLLMGSLKDETQKRLNYLAAIAKQRGTLGTIALLGGKRPLLPEEKDGLPEDIQTEDEMMQYLFNRHEGLKDKDVMIVAAPMIKKDDGTETRPTTDSTLEYFARIAPKPGSCLVISNGQYITRQVLVAHRILSPLGFMIEGDGSDETDTSDIVMLMDEVARILYEVNKLPEEAFKPTKWA